MKRPSSSLLLLAALLLMASDSCSSGSSPTAPEQSLDLNCFNPSATSLECTASIVTSKPITNFVWQATAQSSQNGRGASRATFLYSRFCQTADEPIDVTVSLTVFLDGGEQLGPVPKLYQVCLTSSSSAESTFDYWLSGDRNDLDPDLDARAYGAIALHFLP